MFSTKHTMTASNVSVRTQQGIVEVMKPDVMLDYNTNMTGVHHGGLAKQLVVKGGCEFGEHQSQTSASKRLSAQYFSKKIPAMEKKSNPLRKCKVCASKTKPDGRKFRKETQFYCKPCHVPLCVPQCFTVFHMKAKFTI
ncbi:hypothetical protein PR048_012886 [Dryococelus australis]|uniref:PiggyBac transposable element-derived protein 4 C-terminal zinc-finger domain-containing protein n=1 Tax=Dryococelus australis TaxID=614101 RepID=A0ABQ9HRF3_9NEOP|nr:hypothetical protein PR048_012886 [Dryococelus australis]